MRKIDSIVIHCSDSTFGNVDIIDDWHKTRGWDCIGYHYVITNRNPETTRRENMKADGKIEVGRPIDIRGAHCKELNKTSIGICLIGVKSFTPKQHGTLMKLLIKLCNEHKIDPQRIFCHSEFSPKTCPNFGMVDGETNYDKIRENNIEIIKLIRDMVESMLSWKK